MFYVNTISDHVNKQEIIITLHNIEDITCVRVQQMSEISSSTWEGKIHIHKQACNILFII